MQDKWFVWEKGVWYYEDPNYPVANVRGRGSTKESAYKHWQVLTKPSNDDEAEPAAKFPPTLKSANMLTPQVYAMCRILGIEAESLIHIELHLDSKPAPVLVTACILPADQVEALRKLFAKEKEH